MKKLDGIFSFAIYDSGHDILYLYRDQFGIKPLFYTWLDDEKSIVFASEIKALFKYGDVKPVVDRNGLRDIWSWTGKAARKCSV